MMTESERFDVLAEVFNRMPRSVGGMELREMTAGSFDLLRRRGNGFLLSAGAEDRADDGELRDGEVEGLAEFLWVHVAPLAEVIRLTRDEEGWRDAVTAFALERLSFPLMAEFAREFTAAAQGITAALVDPLEEEGEDEPGKRASSRTGSPATSTRSGDTGAGSGAGGSSGSCPLPRGCSTSTPPTGPTGAGAHGLPEMPAPETEESGTGRRCGSAGKAERCLAEKRPPVAELPALPPDAETPPAKWCPVCGEKMYRAVSGDEYCEYCNWREEPGGAQAVS